MNMTYMSSFFGGGGSNDVMKTLCLVFVEGSVGWLDPGAPCFA
jgi:hypothetical protein